MGANDFTVTLDMIIEERKKRREGWNYILVDEFPPLHTLEALTFLGNWSWTTPATRQRLILKKVAIEYGAGYCTPSDLARDYLECKFPAWKGRCNTKQWHALVKAKKHQPLYALPCWGDGHYLDLKSAYWQILQVGGWDIDYSPNRFIGINSAIWDFPFPEYKLARNCLVSMGLVGKLNTYDPKKGIQWKHKNVKVNLILWGFVQDVLHGIASDMLSIGARYINTDGYIVQTDSLDAAFEVSKLWGVNLVVKDSGWFNVRGVADYDIGFHKSKRRSKAKEYRYLKPTQGTWLREQFKALSHRIIM